MIRKHLIKLTTILALTPLLAVLAYGQKNSKPCHEATRQCMAQMNTQVNQIDAYLKHLKPGSKVIFNPQPDPPGHDPLYRTAITAYQKLQEELYDLSKFPPGPCRTESCHAAIDRANNTFGMLGNASDGASAKTAVASLKTSIAKLSKEPIYPPSERTTSH